MFHIVSKDKGFDPLVKHLKARGIRVVREPNLGATLQPAKKSPVSPKAPPQPAPQAHKPATAQTAKQRAAIIAEALRKPQSTKPRTNKTLAHHVASHFSSQKLTQSEIQAIVDTLRSRGVITIEAGKVSYAL